MGTCGELVSTRTYFLQRHSHACSAGAVWAGRTLYLSHRTRPCSRKPDRLDSTSQSAVAGSVVESRASRLMTEDRHPHRSLLDANACCVTHTRCTWLDPILWGSRMSCGNRPVDMMGNKVDGRMFWANQWDCWPWESGEAAFTRRHQPALLV